MEKKPIRERAIPTGPLKPAVAREIDDNLKRVYQEGLEGQVPDRFKLLLDALRDKERAASDAPVVKTDDPSEETR